MYGVTNLCLLELQRCILKVCPQLLVQTCRLSWCHFRLRVVYDSGGISHAVSSSSQVRLLWRVPAQVRQRQRVEVLHRSLRLLTAHGAGRKWGMCLRSVFELRLFWLLEWMCFTNFWHLGPHSNSGSQSVTVCSSFFGENICLLNALWFKVFNADVFHVCRFFACMVACPRRWTPWIT